MNISCEVIRDLLPLYRDGVCSGESRKLVEEHIAGCASCRAELAGFEGDASAPQDEAALMQGAAKSWKKSKIHSFFSGALIVSVLGCIGCGAAFNIIGSYVAPDGTLVEPFGLIPLAWLFALLSFAFLICFFITKRRVKRK